MARDVSELPQTRVDELEQTLESLREDSEVAHVLLGLSAALAEVRSVEETLQQAVTIVPEILGGDSCVAAAWDEASGTFTVTAHAGLDEHGMDDLTRRATHPDGLPLLRATVAERAPLLLSDPVGAAAISKEESAERGIASYIGIPLLRWGEDFGCLGVFFRSSQQFGPKDVGLARGISRQVGVALSNARQFNLLTGLRTFGQRVGSKLRLAAVVDEVAAGAADLLSAETASLYFLDPSNQTLIASSVDGTSPSIPERLARIDIRAEPWRGLLDGTPVVEPDLQGSLEISEGPVAAVASPVVGTDAGLLGAIVVFFSHSLALGPEDVEALRVLAAQSAMAIENAHRFERQRRVARSLQKGLIATEMPELDGCEIGALYEPAGGEADVGGDFFDVFELEGGRVALAVGDVSGKGAEAAAQTAMSKYMMRAFAMRNPAPSSVLFHLNNALIHGLGEDRFTTVFYGLFEPEGQRITVGRAGHPPPLVYRHDLRTVEVLEVPGGILGAFPDENYEQASFELSDGDVLLAYTDGLIEARAGNELYGRDRVAASLVRLANDWAGEELVRRIYEDAKHFGTVSDDTVVFTVSFSKEQGP
jgi:GAF domain-containing protein